MLVGVPFLTTTCKLQALDIIVYLFSYLEDTEVVLKFITLKDIWDAQRTNFVYVLGVKVVLKFSN